MLLMHKNKQFTSEQRYRIYLRLEEGASKRDIASLIGVYLTLSGQKQRGCFLLRYRKLLSLRFNTQFPKKMRMKTSKLILFFCLFSVASISYLFAQQTGSIVYVDAKELTLIGKANSTPHLYHRIDTLQYQGMPAVVKELFTNSAGLGIVFTTNSNAISARWSTVNPKTGSNMTAIAHKGLDLYIKRDGKWIFAGVGRPTANSTTAQIVENMEDGEKECLLYLPLYDEIKRLEIGVSADSFIKPSADPFCKKVLVYGSSITQGASASRPGMAYPARLSRKSGINFINLGLSGNGKMHQPVADMLSDMEADAYILDCAANPSPDEITQRTGYLVKTIRDRHPDAPIIMIQSVVRESGNFDMKINKRVSGQNRNFKLEFEKLKSAGIKDLYFIEGELLGADHEGTTDGVHPNDLGFDRILDVIERPILEILQQYGI